MRQRQGTTKLEWPAILLLSLLAGVIVDVVARIVARLTVAEASFSIRNVFGNAFAYLWMPLPVAVAAAFAAWAAYIRGPRSVAFVLPLGLSPHAYWTFKAERGELLAIAEGQWTAAALGPLFAWVLCVASVTVAGTLGLLLARVLFERPCDHS